MKMDRAGINVSTVICIGIIKPGEKSLQFCSATCIFTWWGQQIFCDMLAGLIVGSFRASFLLSLDHTLDAFICIFMCYCNVFVYQQCLGISAVYPSVYFGLHGDGMIKLCFGIYAFADFSSKLNL